MDVGYIEVETNSLLVKGSSVKVLFYNDQLSQVLLLHLFLANLQNKRVKL